MQINYLFFVMLNIGNRITDVLRKESKNGFTLMAKAYEFQET